MRKAMTPERWQQVKGVLASALEREDTSDRTAFLSDLCAGDAELEREVQSLLDQPPDEFDSCAETIGLVNPDASAPGRAGRRLGAYEIVRELGRGGMGTVWLGKRADQQFEKLVAVKLLKRGTDTDEVLGRFRAERQILARLEHHNIARLLDAGMTEDGLPYFVMEFVEGMRLTDFVVERQLPLTECVELFLKICGAVQFAHQNLIVHRDLKPGNILVTPEGEPKLLDFGIAKLLAGDEGSWEVTMAGAERLTPGYASPEQVRGETVTTVSDVYSLGALLYEVLAGRPPHEFPSALPTPTQILRVVCEEEPARPSAVAGPERGRELRGDLDTIVLRALSKTPERRYRSAGHLADDLRRYLGGRPVRARPDTFGYRAGKFLGRNKMGAAAATLLLLSLLAGVIATARQAQIANRERARAERRFNDVRKIANSFMFELHSAIKDLPGGLTARQLVTRHALEYLDSLAEESGNDLSLKSELAIAYEKIGLVTFGVQQALNAHRKAVSINEELVRADPKNAAYRKQLSESCKNLGDVLRIAGNSTQAIKQARRSLALIQSLATDDPGAAEIQAALADRYLELGFALIDAGDLRAALQNDLQAMAIQEEVIAENSPDKQALRELGAIYGTISNAYEDSGDYETALAYNRKSQEAMRETVESDPTSASARRDRWAACFRTGRQLALTGETSGALDNYTKATELMEGLAAADPADKGHRRWLALTYLSLGELFAKLDQPNRALEIYRKAIAISEQVFAPDPDRAEVQRDLARMHEAMGLLLANTDQPAPALEYFKKAEAMAQASANHDPQNARVRIRLARIWTEMAGFYRNLADGRDSPVASHDANLKTALDLYRRSLEIWQDLRDKGMLSRIDVSKPEEVAREIANCEPRTSAR